MRSDYDKVLKQRNALLKSAAPVLRRGGRRGARPASEGQSTSSQNASRRCTPSTSGTPTSRTVGSQLLYARLRLLRDLGPYLGKAYDEVSAGQSDARVAYKSSLREETAARIAAGEVPEAEELRDRDARRRWRRCAARRSSAASAWSARTATTSC